MCDGVRLTVRAMANRDGRSFGPRAGAGLALLALLVSGVYVRAAMSDAERREVLDAALLAFDRGTELSRQSSAQAAASYRECVKGLEALVADGVRNGKLYYDLGNAYLQLGQIGNAIANYRRAERLIARDPQLQANLAFARSLCRNQIRPAGGKAALHTVLFWHYDTSLPARFWTAFLAYVLFWVMLMGRSLSRAPAWGYAATALFVVWLAAGTSTAVDWIERSRTIAGVTVTDDIVVRKGNGDGYEPQFLEPLHEGVEFTVIDERPGWYKIELADGSTGWLKRGQVVII